MNYTYPLLLTATIIPQNDASLQLVDPLERYKQYVTTLSKYIFESSFTSFVFCENSTCDLTYIYNLQTIAPLFGKQLEIIQFLWDDQKTQQMTRAYGDQEIMEHAVDNSVLIKEAGWFYKVSGRYRIKNINRLVQDRMDKKTNFIKGGLFKKTVHTAFFKCSIAYFTEHFYGKGEQLKKFEGFSLEKLYYYYIVQSGIRMRTKIHPDFSAERGGWGRMDENFFMRQKTIAFAKLGLYNIN